LFSGSAIDVKPIADDGTYKGNSFSMNAFLGSDNQQKYNITGSELFLGEETQVKRSITTNVVNPNLLGGDSLTPQSPIRDLMGDIDNDPTTVNNTYFYARGTRSNGSSFKEQIVLTDDSTIQSLMDRIEKKFGDNTVNISLNDLGQIVIEDKLRGSSKIDFHMIGAVDYVGTTANVTDIDDLGILGSNTYPPAGDLYVKEFMKSSLISADGATVNIDGIVYDRTKFNISGATLSSSSPQILKKTHIIEEGGYFKDTINNEKQNAFAIPSTLLSEVADTKTLLPKTSPSDPDTYTMSGTTLVMSGNDISGSTFNAEINLTTPVEFVLSNPSSAAAVTYKMYNFDGSDVEADKVSYQQLMDVMNMITTNTLPVGTTATDYHDAIASSNFSGKTSLTYDGKIEFKDLTNAKTRATIALYDKNTDNFTTATDADASVMTFNSNNALTITDPKTDFFKTINEIIEAVESYGNNPNSDADVIRNVGIQNAITMMDDLQDHTFRTQSVAGAQSNILSNSLERAGILEISTMSLRSSVIDTDLAESSLRLSQLTLNYQAMLSTVGKVSKLSLVNYL